jgi:hypothetical protein
VGGEVGRATARFTVPAVLTGDADIAELPVLGPSLAAMGSSLAVAGGLLVLQRRRTRESGRLDP